MAHKVKSHNLVLTQQGNYWTKSGGTCSESTWNTSRTVVIWDVAVSINNANSPLMNKGEYNEYRPSTRLLLSRQQVEASQLTFVNESFASCGVSQATHSCYPSISSYGSDYVSRGINISSYDTALIAATQNSCLKKAADVRANLAITAAEFPKAVKLIGNTARTIAQAILLVKRGRILAAWHTLAPRRPLRKAPVGNQGSRRKWENDFLALRYGWGPLLKDVKDVAELAAQRFIDKPPCYKAKARLGVLQDGTIVPRLAKNKDLNLVRASGSVQSHLDSPVNYQNFNVLDRARIECEAMLYCRVQPGIKLDFNQVVGNPAVIMWELFPLSFVANWFVGVETYLANLTALRGIDVLDGCVTVYKTTEVELTPKPSSSSSDWKYTTQSGRSRENIHIMSRSIWNGASPALQWGSAIKNGFNLMHLAVSVALLKQRLAPRN